MIASGIGSLIARRSAKKAAQPAPAESNANAQQTAAATSLLGGAGQDERLGRSQVNQAGGYFGALAGGDRSKMTATLAPDIESINQTYGGTSRSLRRFLRGPDRDYQMGELERERTGQIASLFRTARTGANEVVARLGQDSLGRAGAQTEAAGGIFANLAGRGMQNRYQGEDLQRQAGQDYGSFFSQLLKNLPTGGSSKTSMPKSWGTSPGGT